MKIKAQVPYKVYNIDLFSTYFYNDPEEVIKSLQQIIEKCKQAGYSNLAVQWSWGDDPYPELYGTREETEKEKKSRIKQEALQEKRKADKIKKEVAYAKEILNKYGEQNEKTE
jgi:hypothetical protein